MTIFDLTADPFDIYATVGDDVVLTFTFLDDQGAAEDMSGYTIVPKVVRSTGATVATMSVGVGGVGNNVVTVTLTDTQTSQIGSARGLRWTMSVTSGSDTQQWVAGEFQLTQVGRTARRGRRTATIAITPTITATVARVAAGAVPAAGDVSIADSGGLFSGSTVEAALQEIGNGTALDGRYAPLRRTVVTQSGTSFTLAAVHEGAMVRATNAAEVTVTIPTDASDDLPDGFTTAIFAEGAAGVTLSTSGITLAGVSPNKSIAQNEAISLTKTSDANTWIAVGGTAA